MRAGSRLDFTTENSVLCASVVKPTGRDPSLEWKKNTEPSRMHRSQLPSSTESSGRGLQVARRPPVATSALLLAVLTLTGCGSTGSPPAATASPPKANLLTGHVVSQGEGVPDAIVGFKGQIGRVSTDAQGRFQLPLEQNSADEPLRVTAAKPGYLIAGAPAAEGMRIELPLLPTEDDPDYEWIDPTPDETASLNCGNCHPQIYQQWHSGGHARATTNRHFLNLYAGTNWDESQHAGWGLLNEYPDGAGVCVACHAPSASLDELGVADIRTLTGTAQHGVHCDFCHKIQDVNLDALGLTHGRFGTELLRPHDEQVFFGPLDDVDRGEDSYLPLYRRSEYCATCHEGIVFGVPVYTTYSEWLESPSRQEGKQCQTCHMRPDGRMTNFAPDAGGIERDPMTLASHELLPGGHQQMLQECLDLTPRGRREEDGVLLSVELLAHDVGHRVPTGFVDRHLILVVEARGEDGQKVAPLTGPRLPAAAGDFADRPGVLFAKLLSDPDGQSPVPFWRAGATVEDTRLEPGVARRVEFRWPAHVRSLRIRLLHRRFWQATAADKNWPDPTLAVIDQTWSLEELLGESAL
jgi:hypothetical protein